VQVEGRTRSHTGVWLNACGWHRLYVQSESGWTEDTARASQLGFTSGITARASVLDALLSQAAREHSCASPAVLAHEGSDATHVWVAACGQVHLYVRRDRAWIEDPLAVEGTP
jgi:hypothetical protein